MGIGDTEEGFASLRCSDACDECTDGVIEKNILTEGEFEADVMCDCPFCEQPQEAESR